MPNEKLEAAVMNMLLGIIYLEIVMQLRNEMKALCAEHELPGLKAICKAAGILAEDD